jgi:hypothetical protein
MTVKSLEDGTATAFVQRPAHAHLSAPPEENAEAGPTRSHSVRRGTPWSRIAIGLLILAVFWLDVLTPAGIAVPMFYVVPILLLMWSGRPWEPPLVAGAATLLTVAGM